MILVLYLFLPHPSSPPQNRDRSPPCLRFSIGVQFLTLATASVQYYTPSNGRGLLTKLREIFQLSVRANKANSQGNSVPGIKYGVGYL